MYTQDLLLEGALSLLGLLPLAMAIGGRDPKGAADPPSPEGPSKEGEFNDHDLARATLAGDATAFRGLVERYQSRIYRLIYAMVRDPDDARDLAQDAFVKAYKNLHQFAFRCSFYSWLARIANNVAIDHLRKQQVRRAQSFDDEILQHEAGGVISLAHHRSDPHREVERKRLHQKLLEALDELSEAHRQIIILREIDGLSYQEIAEVTDVPEGTVMSRLYHARRKLQKALAGEHDG